MSFLTCLVIALGGALGTIARYLLSVATKPISQGVPWGTIGINASGSFLIGLFGTLTLASGRFPLSENARLFVMIGVCGGFPPCSSFSLQTLDLLRGGAMLRASVNVVGSVAVCVLAVALGHLIAAHWNGQAVRIAQLSIEEHG